MQYNESIYNGASYNYTLLNVICDETITPTDNLTKMPMIVKTDSQSSVDALSDGVSMAALLDSIGFIHRARYANPYGAFSYNEAMYNLIEDDDEILLQAIKALTDSIGSSDDLSTVWAVVRTFSETMSETDVLINTPNKSLIEFMFLSELHRVEITNKALNDTVRVADWLTIKRKPQNEEWYD